MTVLIIDDEGAIVRANARVLKGAGVQVITCTEVEEAVAYLTVPPKCVDVVLSDYDMPGGGGPAVLEAARKAGVPLVFYTGNSRVQHEFVLIKPASASDMVSALKRALCIK